MFVFLNKYQNRTGCIISGYNLSLTFSLNCITSISNFVFFRDKDLWKSYWKLTWWYVCSSSKTDIADSTWKFAVRLHVDSAMLVFDDLVFGEEYYIHRCPSIPLWTPMSRRLFEIFSFVKLIFRSFAFRNLNIIPFVKIQDQWTCSSNSDNYWNDYLFLKEVVASTSCKAMARWKKNLYSYIK